MPQINLCKTFLGLIIVSLLNSELTKNERIFIGFNVAAAVIERTGCYHNGSLYADGSFVPTLEPCLNCKCNAKTLVCSLKICSEMPVPPPRGCVLVQKKNTCCPYLSCVRLHDYYNNAISRRIASYLDHYERESIDRVVSDNFLQKRSDDDDFEGVGDICVKNGTVYKSGSAMSSSSLCSYCYCIGGQQRCVKPKCMLPLEGCKPIFVDSTCCPVRYDCSVKSGGGKSGLKEENLKKSNNKHYQRMSQRLQRNRGCQHENNFYLEGQKMSSDNDKPCDICFCIRGKRKCAPKKCSPSLRSCIPVIPKGQCCPSSYDCGPLLREWDRAYQSRQIGLFSWILGEDEPNNSTDGHISEPHPMPEQISPLQTTSEKSIFDVIREGLETIETNKNNDNRDKNNQTDIVLDKPSTTDSNESVEQPQNEQNDETDETDEEEDEDDINLFDLFLQTVTNVTRVPLNSTIPSITSTTTTSNPLPKEQDEESEDYKNYDDVSFFDIFLGKTKERKNATAGKEEELPVTEPYNFDYLGLFNDNNNDTYDYLSVSEPTIEYETTSSEMNTGTTDSIEARSEVLENEGDAEKSYTKHLEATTVKPEYAESNEDVTGGEDYIDSEERNLSTLSSENYSTEDVQVGSLSTEDDSMEQFSTFENDLVKNEKIENIETFTPVVPKLYLSTKGFESTTKAIEKNSPTKHNIQLTTKSLISREPINVKIDLNTTANSELKIANKTEEKPQKLEIKNKISFLSSVIGELTSLMRKTTNITTVKPFENKNRLSNPEKMQNTLLKQNTTSDVTIPPFKKLHYKNFNNLLLEATIQPNISSNKRTNSTLELLKDRKTTAFTITKLPATHSPKPKATTKSPSLNYLIEGGDYDHNTLPPSLPNLEIIPFLPIDALPIKEKIAAKPTYSAVTERQGSAENIWPDLIDDVRPFGDSDGLPSLTYMNPKMDEFNKASHNLFSPPKKTEGGFVPKQPIVDGNLYYGTKLITELTTITPSLNVNKFFKIPSSTETPIAITSTDPFKDVLKTESPPDLVLLIEDKEKQLLGKQSQNHKEIIHITTDATYNYDSNFQQNNIIQIDNINFNDLNITESGNNILAENFPLDRHENISFTEKPADMIDNTFGSNPSILLSNTNTNLSVQPLENDVLAENFPLDRHDNFKEVQYNNNMTLANVDSILENDYVDSDNAGFESFLDYFLGGNGQISKSNMTVTSTIKPLSTTAPTIPPFKVIPSNLSLLPNLNSGQINEQLQSDVLTSNKSLSSYKINDTPDLSILGELLNGNSHRFGESELYKPKLQRPFSLPNKTELVEQNKTANTISTDSIQISDPFKGLPGLIPSYPIKRPSEIKQQTESDLSALLNQIQKEPFTVGAYKVIQNETELISTDPYVVNPIDIEKLKKQQQMQQQHQQHKQYHHILQQSEQQNDIHAEIFSKPEHLTNMNDPAGILKLAGCNIYGRMYRVGRIISELSNACLECKCTEIGVSCISLECSRAVAN